MATIALKSVFLGACATTVLTACSGVRDGADRVLSPQTSGGQASETGGLKADGTGGQPAGTGGQTLSSGGLIFPSGGTVGAPDDASMPGRDSSMPGDAAVCGVGTTSAQRSPVNMLVMLDRSGSMRDDDKWGNATAAFVSFFEHPQAAGLRMALRLFPHDEPAQGCTKDGCNADACAQPLVELGELSEDSAPMDAQEANLVSAITGATPGSGGTPIYAALGGALQWAAGHRQAFPDENTVVVFVTDGDPNGCDEDPGNIAMLASTALADHGVTTYAIGLEGSNVAQMDQLASAGGTGAGIYIGGSANAQQELLDALNAIRTENISCDVEMPTPTDDSDEVDLNKINVTFKNGAGMAFTVGQVDADSSCGTTQSWYYDDPITPTRIRLCPATCDTVNADPDGALEILLGCPTVCGGLDVECEGQTMPPEVPPLLE